MALNEHLCPIRRHKRLKSMTCDSFILLKLFGGHALLANLVDAYQVGVDDARELLAKPNQSRVGGSCGARPLPSIPSACTLSV